MASALGNVTSALESMIQAFGSASNLTAKHMKIVDQDSQASRALGNSINFFDSAVRANIATLNKNARELESLTVKSQNYNARVKIAEKLTQHWTKSLVELGNAGSSASNKIVSSVSAMSSSLETTTAKFGNLRDTLLEFNRTAFEVTRSADMLGKSQPLTPRFWDDVSKSTALSKQQFLSLQKEMIRMSEVTPMVGDDFLKLTAILQDRLGPAFSATEESLQRMVKMNNRIPGLTKEIMKMAAAGTSLASVDMSNISLLMKDFGADVRDLDVMNQIVKKMGDGEKGLMKFEQVAMKRDQAIRDTNINTAKSAEESMMNIERAMTKVTKQIDKMLQKFNVLVDAFVYIKQIAAISFGGLLSALAGAIRYTQTLTANFLRAAAAAKGITFPAGVASGSAAGGMGMLGGAMAMIPAAMQGYQAYNEIRGPGANASMQDKYAADRNRNKGIGRGIGTGAGMLIGGAIGSAVPVVGTAVGAGLGAWAGGAAGGYIGGKMGDSEEKTRGYEKIAASFDKRQLKVEGIMRSEKDVVRTIMAQKDMTDKTVAVHAILNDGLMDENKLRKAAIDIGAKEVVQMIERKKVIDAAAKASEKDNKTAIAKVRLLENQLKMLEAIQKVYGDISKNASEIGDVLVETWASAGASDQFKLSAEYSGRVYKELVKSSAVLQEMYNEQLKLNVMKASVKDPVDFLKSKGVADPDVKNIETSWSSVLKAKQAVNDTSSSSEKEKIAAQAVLEAAEKTYETSLDQAKIEGEIRKQLQVRTDYAQKNLKSLFAQGSVMHSMMLDAQQIALAKKTISISLKGVTADYESELGLMDAQLRVQRAQASVAEKSAAGYSVSYAHQKQIYDNLVGQRRVTQQMLGDLEKRSPASVWGEFGIALERAGVKMSDLNNLERNRGDIVDKINAAKKGSGPEEIKGLRDAEIGVNTALAVQLQTREKILGLQEQELDMAMHLREGYLDVINEMTTGKDMMAQMLPDANRGIMALQEIGMRVKGDEFGGAMKRGFVSFSPFAESQDLSKAPKFTKQGFVPPSKSGAVEKYQSDLLRLTEASARTAGAGGQFAGQKPLDMSAAYAVGGGVSGPQTLNTTQTDVHTDHVMMDVKTLTVKNMGRMNSAPAAPSEGGRARTSIPIDLKAQGRASGGLIPGSPSDRDNLLGMVDGRQPIGLASGEFVVNAKAAQKNRGLLESINGGGGDSSSIGLAGGGRAVARSWTNWKVGVGTPDMMEWYFKIPEEELVKRSRTDPRALSALAIRIKRERGGSLSDADAMKMAKFRSMSILNKIGTGAIGAVGHVAGSIFSNLKQIGGGWGAVSPSGRSVGGTGSGPSISKSSPDDSIRAKKMEKIRMIQREVLIRPGLSDHIESKTGGKKSMGAWISAYDEFMSGTGARQDARIANTKEVDQFSNSNKTFKRQSLAAYNHRILADATQEEAKRGSRLAMTRGPQYHAWKKARDKAEQFWLSPDEKKANLERQKVEREKIIKISNGSIASYAGGGSIGMGTLAAMMSGTISIGSLNVNGQALARNLSGANDMSIAMEQARQNHFT